MPITSLAGRTITVTRRTAVLLSGSALVAPPTTVALTRQPAANAFVQITISGAPSFGTMTISGTIGGVADTEAIIFTVNGARTTTKRFDSGSITGIDLTGWGGAGTFTAESVGSDGAPEHVGYTLVSGWPARFDRARGRWPNLASGVTEMERTRVYIDWTDAWSPREGDAFTDERTSEQWFVIGHPDLHGGGSPAPHHWEIDVTRRKGSATT